MSAYLNAAQLRTAADLLDGLPPEFRQGEYEVEGGTLAVWMDTEAGRPYVRVMDADENEAAG